MPKDNSQRPALTDKHALKIKRAHLIRGREKFLVRRAQEIAEVEEQIRLIEQE